MKEYAFKLYYPSGKSFLTQEFGDKNFINCFDVFDKKVIYTADTTITVAEYSSESRAYEVCDEIVNAYNNRKSYKLPAE